MTEFKYPTSYLGERILKPEKFHTFRQFETSIRFRVSAHLVKHEERVFWRVSYREYVKEDTVGPATVVFEGNWIGAKSCMSQTIGSLFNKRIPTPMGVGLRTPGSKTESGRRGAARRERIKYGSEWEEKREQRRISKQQEIDAEREQMNSNPIYGMF